MTHPRRTSVSLLVSGALLLAAGCTGPSAGGPTIESGHIRLTLPAGWQPAEGVATAAPWTVVYTHPEKGLQLRVAGQLEEIGNAQGTLGHFDMTERSKVPEYATTSTNKVTVKGSEDAVERRYTFKDASGQTKQGALIIASQFLYRADAGVEITGPQVDRALLDEVYAGLTYLEKH